MKLSRSKWLLRLALPAVAFGIALLCERSLVASVGMVALTAFLILILVANPLVPFGFIFTPLLGLYGLKFSSRDEPEMDLDDPDTQLFLFLGIPAALVMVALLSLFAH